MSQITKYDPSGKIVYIGPDEAGGWERNPETDALGRFEIREDSYIYTDARGNRKRGNRPMGSVFPHRRPGRYIKPGTYQGRSW